LSWCAGPPCVFGSLNKTNQRNKIDQQDQFNQIPATRYEMIECKAGLILGEGTSSQRPLGTYGL
jgi:hypothetical protein